MKILFLSLFLVAGCHQVLRDEPVYKNEVAFMSAATTQTADAAELLIKTYCKCETAADGSKSFTTPECADAAKKAVVVKTRVPWHAAMMLYNARITTDRPVVAPPTIPAATTLCPQ